MRALVWFRCDLRTRDNTALAEASSAADGGVVGVFTICPDQWREHDWGAMKVNFLLRNLRELSASLASINIPLKIVTTPRFQGVPGALDRLARECECDALYFNREYEVNEQRRDERVEAVFRKAGRKVYPLHDKTHFPPGELRTQQGGWYTVFSPLKRSWREAFKATPDNEGCKKVRRSPSARPDTGIKPDKVPDKIEGFDAGADRPDLWKAGEDHARDRLRAFIDSRIDDYKDKRDFPGVNATSTLSPYLALGVISPRQCVEAARAANDGQIDSGSRGVVHWIDEMVWREFYQHILAGFPRVCMGRAFKREYDRVEWDNDEEKFEAWKEGRTGYPIVDAAMRQLNQTGWMHNRLRMIAASFLTKDLFLDWRRGERYFMNRLVDADLGSNNGGWQWSASTGTDAQPYFRIFNPTSQSERFDPEGDFIRRFVPELESLDSKQIHAPHERAQDLFSKLDYPKPIVDHKKARERAIKALEGVKP
ncbi:MAG: deoxyribodipyrimidine photo-lyase [Phycisphaerales bacterium]|nr:deoxyribodipyrimidine photo-lyase [Phycisphaerales bacterium]